MRRLFPLSALCSVLVVLAAPAVPTAARAGDLTVAVTGISPADGDIRVILMDGRDHDMMQDHMRTLKAAKADQGSLSARFIGLAPGEYGVIAYRQQSGRPGLDQTRLTMGRESQTLTLPLAAH